MCFTSSPQCLASFQWIFCFVVCWNSLYWFVGVFVAFHVHRYQATQDQYLARLHVGMCAAMEEKSHCWDPSDPPAFRDFLLSSSSARATLSLPLVTSFNLSQGIVASKVGLGRTVSIPLGIRGDKYHQKRFTCIKKKI